MKYRRFTKKHVFIFCSALVVIMLIAGAFWLSKNTKNTSNKPNPTPGSGKSASAASKEAEQKQQAKTQALNKKLTDAPKDPKTRCEITYKFDAEQKRDEQIEAENKRHDAYIKKFGDNRAEQYTHKQNLERIQKQFEKSLNNMNCK